MNLSSGSTLYAARTRTCHLAVKVVIGAVRLASVVVGAGGAMLGAVSATAAVCSPTDANCCPSRIAEMRLRLRNEVLELVELRLRRADPLRTDSRGIP
jgi:hypothetical protein